MLPSMEENESAAAMAARLKAMGVEEKSVNYVRSKMHPLMSDLVKFMLGTCPENPEMELLFWLLARMGAPQEMIVMLREWFANGSIPATPCSNFDPSSPAKRMMQSERTSQRNESGPGGAFHIVDEDGDEPASFLIPQKFAKGGQIGGGVEASPANSQSMSQTMPIPSSPNKAENHGMWMALKKKRLGMSANTLVTPSGKKIQKEAAEVPTLTYQEKFDYIRKSPCFNGLGENDLNLLVAAFTPKSFREGEEVIHHGDDEAAMHIICKGRAKVFQSKETATLKSGEAFGDTALINDTPYLDSIEAADGNLVTLSIDRATFQALNMRRKLNKMEKKDKAILGGGRGNADTRKLFHRGDTVTVCHPETAADKDLIIEALAHNSNVSEVVSLSAQQMKALAEAAVRQELKSGSDVFHEGDYGDALYVIADGIFAALPPRSQRRGTCADTMNLPGNQKLRSGDSFGELALLHDAPRGRTVKCVQDGVLWLVTRSSFTSVISTRAEARLNEYEVLINSCPVLSEKLSEEQKELLCQALEERFFIQGENVVTQGEMGDTFYIIFHGTCDIIMDGETKRTLSVGDFFGEKALLTDEPRGATVRATSKECTMLALDRIAFNLLFTDDADCMRLANRGRRDSKTLDEYIPMETLERVGVLGQGSFGFVTLEKRDGTLYALKRMSKGHIVTERLTDAVKNEVICMGILKSPFIVALYQTYSDDTAVYLLLEPAFGGELFDAFNEYHLFGMEDLCRFYAACATLGLEHMHSRRVIWRDLKLENCLLTSNGYMKLTDFGIAKLVIGKTYTVCGTTDYFAPETLRQSGHNRGVDWWALGVMTYIMMVGCSPFDAPDVMQIYKKICKGMNKVHFPLDVSDEAKGVIVGLCQKTPQERLTMGNLGVQNLKDQVWFSDKEGFSWKELMAHEMLPPWVPDVNENSIVDAIRAKSPVEAPVWEYEDDGSGWDACFDQEPEIDGLEVDLTDGKRMSRRRSSGKEKGADGTTRSSVVSIFDDTKKGMAMGKMASNGGKNIFEEDGKTGKSNSKDSSSVDGKKKGCLKSHTESQE